MELKYDPQANLPLPSTEPHAQAHIAHTHAPTREASNDPTISRAPPSALLAEARTQLVQATQVLAALGDPTVPQPKEDFPSWQNRREKITYTHQLIATLKSKIPQYEHQLEEEARLTKAHALKEQLVFTRELIDRYRSLASMFDNVRKQIEQAEKTCCNKHGYRKGYPVTIHSSCGLDKSIMSPALACTIPAFSGRTEFNFE